MHDIRCILFDLGGVLVDFRGVERLAEWLGDAEVAEEHWRRWLGAGSLRQFELGRLTPEEFAIRFLEEFELDLTPGQVLEEMRGFVSGPLDGAVELLDELRPHYLLACLSNTNRLHWPWMSAELGLDRRLDRAFASCEIGRLKPDPEAFHHVCRELGLAPEEILFFDDAAINVEAARAVGFEAVRSLGPADCRRELDRRGLLPACGEDPPARPK